MNETEVRLFLGYRVKTARLSKFKTIEAARQAAGVARGTWEKAERGDPVKEFSWAAIESALDWEPGFAKRYLAGDEPLAANVSPAEQPVDDLPTTNRQNRFFAGAVVLINEFREVLPHMAADVERLDGEFTRLFREFVNALREGGEEHDGSPATKEPLSVVPDEMPAAAKEGTIEESGEFNT